MAVFPPSWLHFALCPPLHQFWHLFDSSFCIFHLCWGSFEPVALQPVCLGIRRVYHSSGQAHTARDRLRLCLQTPLHILLGHITRLGYNSDTCALMGTLFFRGERLLLASSGEIKPTMTVSGSLRYPLSCYYFIQLIDIKCLLVRLPSPITCLQAVISLARLWCRTFRSWLSRNDRLSQIPWKLGLADQKRSTPGKSLQCLHACPSCQAIVPHSCSEPGEWVSALHASLERASPFLFLQRTRVILFKSSLAQSHLTQVPDRQLLPREMRKTKSFVAHIASWSWMMLIAPKAINFRKLSLAHWVRNTTTTQDIKIHIIAHYFTNLRRPAVACLACDSQTRIVWVLPGNFKPWFWNAIQGFSSGLAEDFYPGKLQP